MGRKEGLGQDKLEGLADYENSGAYSPRELAVLRYADALTATPVTVSDEVFSALAVFYDQPQIVELTSALAWENYRARFDHSLGMEAEGFSEGAFCPLPTSGVPIHPHVDAGG
ncbi:MAG: hypothetical protein VCA74_06020 [Deltaproteobacteria bacterium]